MFNKLPTLILIVYLNGTVISQLSECVSPDDLFNYENFQLHPNAVFNKSDFLKTNIPDFHKLQGKGYNYVGSSYDSIVVGTTMIDLNLGKFFHTVVKVFGYETQDQLRASDEIKLNKELSWTDPLAAPIYIGCAHDINKRRVFINSEYLDNTIDIDSFFKLVKSPRQKTEQFNLMARALLKLHSKGYCHNDVKPDNFMYKYVNEKNLTITKLIDFGSATEIGANYYAGTPLTIAPERLIRPFKTTIESDNYSLGIVFYITVYGEELMDIDNEEYNEDDDITFRFNQRHEKIENQITHIEGKYHKYDQKNVDILSALHRVIRGLTNPVMRQRMELTKVIEIFEEVLSEYEPESPYLTKNAKDLFKAVYPNSEYYHARYSKPTNTSSQKSGGSSIFSNVFGCMSSQKTNKPKHKVITGGVPEFNYPEQEILINHSNLEGQSPIRERLII